jgi:hypothetical protein
LIAFKLFRVRKDGTLGPLFINCSQRIKPGIWMNAEDHPTTGYAHRPGWHCTPIPAAAHLSLKGRHWFKVEIEGVRTFPRPNNQGGLWYLADRLRVLEPA